MYSQNRSEQLVIDKIKATSPMVKQNPSACIERNLELLKVSKNNQYSHAKACCLINIAASFLELGSLENALNYSFEAENTAARIKDNMILADAIRTQAVIYAEIGTYNESFKLVEKSIAISKKIKDNESRQISLGNAYLSKASIFFADQSISLDSCVKYDQKAIYNYSKIRNDSVKLAYIDAGFSNLGDDYFTLNKMDSAKIYLNKGLVVSRKAKAVYTELFALHCLGKIAASQNEDIVALRYFDEAEYIAKSKKQNKFLRDIYADMSKLYNKLADEKNTNKYLILYKKVNEETIEVEKKQLASILNIILQQKEKSYGKEISSTNKFFAYIIFISAVVVLSLIVFFAKLRQKKAEKVAMGLANSGEINDVDNDDDQTEEDIKSKESVEELVSLALKNNTLFLEKFKEVFPSFIKNLLTIAPGLNQTDLKFCGLLKIGFNTKQIATYTNTSVRSVEAKKYRLRKKLNIPAEEVIATWLMNMDG